jgi:hypothetical protein
MSFSSCLSCGFLIFFFEGDASVGSFGNSQQMFQANSDPG